tara:strand:- start:311 stop:547 length:237 start_codon:yes stop_codon:yes gene_type:complete
MKSFTLEEISKHNTLEDCYIIIDNNVYDMSNFSHPGGPIILNYAGIDATKIFKEIHNPHIIKKFKKNIIGLVINNSKL